jgi:hypothetical protein
MFPWFGSPLRTEHYSQGRPLITTQRNSVLARCRGSITTWADTKARPPRQFGLTMAMSSIQISLCQPFAD